MPKIFASLFGCLLGFLVFSLFFSVYYFGHSAYVERVAFMEQKKVSNEWINQCVVENQTLPSPRPVCEAKYQLSLKKHS